MENGSFRLVSNFVLTLVQVWKNWCILRLQFVSFFFYFFSPLFLAFKFLKLNWNAYTCVRSILKQKHSNLFFWVLRLPRLTMPLRFVQDNAAHTVGNKRVKWKFCVKGLAHRGLKELGGQNDRQQFREYSVKGCYICLSVGCDFTAFFKLSCASLYFHVCIILLIPCRMCGLSYPRKATAAVGLALPNPATGLVIIIMNVSDPHLRVRVQTGPGLVEAKSVGYIGWRLARATRSQEANASAGRDRTFEFIFSPLHLETLFFFLSLSLFF